MSRRLRVAHVVVQVVLVWDDGENLEPGPAVQPQQLPLTKISDWLAAIPGELDRLAGPPIDDESQEQPLRAVE